MLWAQLTAALFMTVPKKLCPLADGSLAEAARGGGGSEDIAERGGAVAADEDLRACAVWAKIYRPIFMCGKRTQDIGPSEAA